MVLTESPNGHFYVLQSVHLNEGCALNYPRPAPWKSLNKIFEYIYAMSSAEVPEVLQNLFKNDQ